MLKELMLPAEIKLLKPNPAGCWHCVPAMMHGLLVLCGPRVFPCIRAVSVRAAAEAGPVSADIAAVAPIPIQAKRDLHIMIHSLGRLGNHYTLRKYRAGQTLIFGRLLSFFGRLFIAKHFRPK